MRIIRFVAIALLVGFFSPLFAAVWSWKVVDSLPHPQTRFTQGLFWDGNQLVESTGLVGRSFVYRMDSTAKTLDSVAIPSPHFGEGCARIGDQIFVLTWRSGVAFVLRTDSLDTVGVFSIPGEGWGLAAANNLLWMTNGSDKILKLSPASHEVVGELAVRAGLQPVQKLNELEVVGNRIYANIWFSDSIAVIDAATGKVQAWLDLSSLAKRVRQASRGAEVLNGIAWDGRRLWITGKLWTQFFALEIQESQKKSRK
ncbi:MAG TPA: glutaminyl-peptide cyclotransferase [Fibrobacteraceae bacterium]|nr:glutaminyl-peptide cyclotransferase [Fibrobacteraceae bacterium]